MLTGNLATRPFYNERVVRGVLIVALAAAVAWTAVSVTSFASLMQQSTMLGDRIRDEGRRASGARTEADAVRRGLNPADLRTVSTAAGEANALIQRRTFSWTGLFNQLETTMPPDVRLVQVQPQTDDQGRLLLSLIVISKTIEDLDAFIEALEATRAFTGILSRSDSALEDGAIESALQGYYAAAANPLAPSSEPSSASGTPRPTPEAPR